MVPTNLGRCSGLVDGRRNVHRRDDSVGLVWHNACRNICYDGRMETLNSLPIIFFESEHTWEVWLTKHCSEPQGIWIKFAKKHTGIPSLSYAQALDGALCYGWIDGQSKTYDNRYYLQKFTPRRARSLWSKRNTGKATQLIADGRMKPSGLAAIESAKKDGRWEQAYDSQGNSSVPRDFQAALDQHPKAKTAFEALTSINRYAFLWRIQTAKKAETKAKRIAQFVQMLEKGETLY